MTGPRQDNAKTETAAVSDPTRATTARVESLDERLLRTYDEAKASGSGPGVARRDLPFGTAATEHEPVFAFVTATLPWDQARRWLLDFERDYADLDPGIRFAVRTLRAAGVETFESCQGGEGHAYAEPTVRFNGQQSAGWRALTAVMEYGLPVSAIRQTWPVWEGQPHGPYWEITFAEPIDRPTLEVPDGT